MADPVLFRGKQYRYHTFITHCWGNDELGRDKHSRAKLINMALKAEGLSTCF